MIKYNILARSVSFSEEFYIGTIFHNELNGWLIFYAYIMLCYIELVMHCYVVNFYAYVMWCVVFNLDLLR